MCVCEERVKKEATSFFSPTIGYVQIEETESKLALS